MRSMNCVLRIARGIFMRASTFITNASAEPLNSVAPPASIMAL